jgi:glycosyltransferase involved in cell wall biosynthesis
MGNLQGSAQKQHAVGPAAVRTANVSFIIPAYNESRFIGLTVGSIRQFAHPDFPYEVVVADHGSTDGTPGIARQAGARVIVAPHATSIAELRNFAIAESTGDILVFLDADTTITREWQGAFPRAVEELLRDPMTLTGATRGIPASAGWVSGMWYYGFDRNLRPAHLGGGHIITTRDVVESTRGFPAELETGEDYEFCARARRNGAKILVIQDLRALHHGVPQNFRQFFTREIWHGRGDWQWPTVLRSKVAWSTLVFLLAHLALGYALASSVEQPLATGALLVIVGVCIASALAKQRGSPMSVLSANIPLFYAYYWARVASLASAIGRPQKQRRMRA